MTNDSPVLNGQTITHFIPYKRQIKPSTQEVRPGAFEPYNGEVSCFDINQMNDADIWPLAKARELTLGRRVYGRADFISDEIYNAQLKAFYSPPDHHLDIVDWNNIEELRMDQQKYLAAHSTFIKTPE